MENTSTKYSKLSIVGFALGCVALASWIMGNLFGLYFPANQGFVPPFVLEHGFFFGILEILIVILPVVVLIMAVATQLYLEFGSTLRKGKGLAWLGFSLSVIPWVIGGILSP